MERLTTGLGDSDRTNADILSRQRELAAQTLLLHSLGLAAMSPGQITSAEQLIISAPARVSTGFAVGGQL